MKPSNKDAYFVNLDGLRGVAAFAVILFHIDAEKTPWLSPRGGLAVDFFFVLSGFVIAHAYEDRLRNGMTTSRFMVLRLVRLVPLMWVGTLFGAIAYRHLYSLHLLMINTISCLFLIPVWTGSSEMHNPAFPVNPALWSLFFEIYGNAFYASLVRKTPTYRYLIVFAILMSVMLVYQTFYFKTIVAGPLWPNFGFGFPRFFSSFFLGVCICKIYIKFDMKIPRVNLWILIAFLSAVLSVPKSKLPYDFVIDLVIVLLIMPLVVIFGTVAKSGPKTQAVSKLVGRLSYPLYVLHGGCVAYLRWPNTFFHLSGLGALPVSIGVAIAFAFSAWIVLVNFDEPLRLRLRAFTKRSDKDVNVNVLASTNFQVTSVAKVHTAEQHR